MKTFLVIVMFIIISRVSWLVGKVIGSKNK